MFFLSPLFLPKTQHSGEEITSAIIPHSLGKASLQFDQGQIFPALSNLVFQNIVLTPSSDSLS